MTSEFDILARGLTVEGSITSAGSLRIAGRVRGTVVLAGDLVLEPDATIVGEVRCRSAELFSQVEGNVSATHSVRLGKGCVVRGDVRAPRVIMDEGARLIGAVVRDSVDSTVPSSEPANAVTQPPESRVESSERWVESAIDPEIEEEEIPSLRPYPHREGLSVKRRLIVRRRNQGD